MNTFDEKIYLEAVKNNGLSLQYVPDNMKTYEICLEAVKNNHYSLEFVPDDLLTKDIVYAAYSQKSSFIMQLGTQLGQRLGLATISLIDDKSMIINPNTLTFTSDTKITPKIAFLLVQIDGLALTFVPDNMKTYEICLEAVKNNGLAIKFVPHDMMTNEICLEAVKNNGYSLKFVPEDMKTNEICLKAVKKYGHSLEFIPDEFLTKGIVYAAYSQMPFTFHLFHVFQDVLYKCKDVLALASRIFKYIK
jgi:hypothetical protein